MKTNRRNLNDWNTSLQETRHQSTIINVIYTPGICDNRYDDETTLANVARYLALCDFSTLHGVCVLLHQNVSRLSAEFEVCFTDLFKMLPRAALRNVVFCFTHTHTQEPDDTIPILIKLLKTVKIDKDVLLSANTYYYTDDVGLNRRQTEQNIFHCLTYGVNQPAPADFFSVKHLGC